MSYLMRKGGILTVFRRIVFSFVVMALAIAPGTVRHSVADDVEPPQQTCSVNYRNLISDLQRHDTDSEIAEVAQIFCNHFSASPNHLTHTSSSEMVHAAPLFLIAESDLMIVHRSAVAVLFPRNIIPDSLHPEVPSHPPKA